MIFKSNAKINIGLHVKNKRSDGYHNIESVFYPIPLLDSIEIIESKNLEFYSKKIKINELDNLIIDAFHLIRKHYKIPNLTITIDKNIPLGAGLGGGSSNAAFTLIALNQLFNLNLSKQELVDFALELGSDCPFFIHNTPSIVFGRGEILKSTSFNLKDKYIKLVNPKIHISTKKAFQELNTKNKAPAISESLLLNDNWHHYLKNDFEAGIVNEFPAIGKSLQALKNEGAYFASLSGTGSSIFGLFQKRPVLKNIENEMVFKL